MVCFVLKSITCKYLSNQEGVLILWQLWEVFTPDENRRLRKARETLMSWLITLEALSTQEDNLYQAISLQEKKSARNNNNILNRHYPEGEVGPSKSGRTSINTGHQFSFVTSQDCSFPSWCALQLQFGAQVWRRVAGVVVVAVSSQFWLEYILARVWDYLISLLCCAILGERCVVLCLAIQPSVCFRRNSQVKVKVLGGRLRPVVG